MTLSATDDRSGVSLIYYSVGVNPTYPATVYTPGRRPVLNNGERIRFYATDFAGNAGAPQLSAPAKIDPSAPDTALDEAPSGAIADTRPQLRFSSPAPQATFECSVDGAGFAACFSPFRPADALGDGEHTVRVRAISRAGLPDPIPASATFTVDTTGPQTTFTKRPPATTTASDASLAFASELGAAFTCSLDGARPDACESPLSLTGLAPGEHTLAVVARDLLGNAGPAATATWTVTVVAPEYPPPGPPAPAPVPAPAAEPASELPAPTFKLASASAQQLLVARGIAVSVGCGATACRVTVTAQVRGPHGAAITLPSQQASLPAGRSRSLRLATTAKQRAQLRKLLRRAGKRATLCYTITAVAVDGTRLRRTGTIALER